MMPIDWRNILPYDLDTGDLKWKLSPNRGIHAGDKIKPASAKGHGYRKVQYKGHRESAHRIAWKIVHGHIPEGFTVDHINHIRHDDRLSNLRLVTQGDNCRNRTKTQANTSGVVGVIFHKQSGKWRARIAASGKLISLGLFSNFQDAVFARKSAEIKCGYHPDHGSDGEYYVNNSTRRS